MPSLIEFNGKKPALGDRVFVAEGARLIGDVEVGEDSSIFYNSVLRADLAEIRIGKRTNIQDNVTVHLATDQGVFVGDEVTVGHNAILHACTIEDNVLVGMGAIVMDGARIRRNSVVAAGALVPQNKEYPEKSLIVGAPARVVRTLTDEEIRKFHEGALHYVEVKEILRQGQL